MPQLNRCHVAALNHGYRIGLQIGEHGSVAVACRDIAGDRPAIIVMGNDIEYVSTVLFAKMLAETYIPRSIDSVHD